MPCVIIRTCTSEALLLCPKTCHVYYRLKSHTYSSVRSQSTPNSLPASDEPAAAAALFLRRGHLGFLRRFAAASRVTSLRSSAISLCLHTGIVRVDLSRKTRPEPATLVAAPFVSGGQDTSVFKHPSPRPLNALHGVDAVLCPADFSMAVSFSTSSLLFESCGSITAKVVLSYFRTPQKFSTKRNIA